MNIDGTNTLACLKPVAESVTNGKIKIYPLPHLRTFNSLFARLSSQAHDEPVFMLVFVCSRGEGSGAGPEQLL
jgi:hypothetical protein